MDGAVRCIPARGAGCRQRRLSDALLTGGAAAAAAGRAGVNHAAMCDDVASAVCCWSIAGHRRAAAPSEAARLTPAGPLVSPGQPGALIGQSRRVPVHRATRCRPHTPLTPSPRPSLITSAAAASWRATRLVPPAGGAPCRLVPPAGGAPCRLVPPVGGSPADWCRRLEDLLPTGAAG